MSGLPAKVRASVGDRFDAIDWSFPDSVPDPVHEIHPYPARFIPEIPAAALELLPSEGDVIDPFCGIGTSLVECARRGRGAVGIDLNPIATLATEAKFSGWSAADAVSVHSHKAGLEDAVLAGDRAQLDAAQRAIPRLDHWFEPDVQAAIAGAVSYITAMEAEDPWSTRLRAALSSILVKVSRQESDTRYAAISKGTERSDVVRALRGAIDRVARAAFVLSEQIPNGTRVQIHTGDAADLERHVQPRSLAGAIFSPPYPNAYEYWLYHKYRMYWLGFDPLKVRASEVGARPFYSGSGTLTEDDFRRQMEKVLAGLATSLREDGLVFVVVGDSRIRGRHVDNRHVFESAAAATGFELVAGARRQIRRTRRSFNLAVARATHEHVLLFGLR